MEHGHRDGLQFEGASEVVVQSAGTTEGIEALCPSMLIFMGSDVALLSAVEVWRIALSSSLYAWHSAHVIC
jgi:hypothetical protein